MGSYKQIQDFGLFGRLNLAEKLDVIGLYLNLIPREGDSAPAIRTSKEQIDALQDVFNQMQSLMGFTRGAAETTRLYEAEAERNKLVQNVIQRVLTPKKLPLEEERVAAKKLYNEVIGLKGFYRRTQLKKKEAAKVLLDDLENPKYVEYTRTLGIDKYVPKLKLLIEEYDRLNKLRQHKYSQDSELPTVYSLMLRATELLQDINVQANASVVFQPSEAVFKFVDGVNFIFDDARTNFKQRKKRRKKTKAEGAGSGKKVAKKISPKA